MRILNMCCILAVLAVTACALDGPDATSEATSNLCTIADQQAGLCDGPGGGLSPMDQAYGAAIDSGYDPYNDPRVLVGCLSQSGACYVVVTELGGLCGNWFVICGSGTCTSGCMQNGANIPLPP